MSLDALRNLGKTDIKVSPIGLGCWQFSKKSGLTGRYWPDLSDDEITRIVASSLDGGLNWFDTAENYGGGASERALSRALNRLEVPTSQVVIATKWWPILRRAGSIVNTIEKRLEALGVNQIDLYQIHLPYSLSSVRQEMHAMAELVAAKKICSVGLSNYSADSMRIAHATLQEYGLVLATNQVQYNLLEREIETNGILDTARELGITIIAYSPLAQGLLAGKYHAEPSRLRDVGAFRKIYEGFSQRLLAKTQPVVDVLRSLAEKYQVTPAQVALNWVIHVHGDSIVTVVGATKVSHSEDNARAMRFSLAESDIAELDRISWQHQI